MRGVQTVRVVSCTSEVIVTRQAGTASDGQLLMALRMIGKRASVIPVESTVLRLVPKNRGQSSQQACAALRRIQGVRNVRNRNGNRAEVTYDRRRVRTTDLVAAVGRAGYTAKIESQAPATSRALPAPQVRPAARTTTVSSRTTTRR